MKKKCRFSLCVAILIVFISVSLAYVLLGYKWPVGSTEPYRINENTAQVADERNAVVSAMSSWNGINPSGLTLSYAGSTSVITYSYNGSNTVCWNNLGATGALATAYMWYSGSTMVETDVVFNDFYTWSTSGGNYDVQTVALHELGHCVGLNHSSTGIMRPSYSGIQRSIDSDAEAGFIAMYGGGGSSPSISLDRTSLSFTGAGEKIFKVRNSGAGTLSYQMSDNKNWMSVSPESGDSTGEWDEIAVNVDSSGLGGGSYSGTVTVSSGDADNSPQKLNVYLTLKGDQPPTVSITFPLDGDVVTEKITVKAIASDDKGIKKVEFYLDGKLKKTLKSTPYNYLWNCENYSSGSHTIKVKAYDTISQVGEDSIKVIVDQPPKVTITSPSSGDIVSKKVTIKVKASDDNGIKKVEFYIGGKLKKTQEKPPYRYRWDAVNYSGGKHTIKVKAYDTRDQVAEDSIKVIVDKPPKISITSPISGSDVIGNVSIQTSASDDRGIKKVGFFINGHLKKTDTKSPYDFIWNTASVFNGAYTIKAVVYDTINQTAHDKIAVILIPHAPLSFSGQKQNNSSTLLQQFINVLTWQASPMNENINKYRIYRIEEGSRTLLIELDATTFEYWHTDVEKDLMYTYALVAVDSENREGVPANITVR